MGDSVGGHFIHEGLALVVGEVAGSRRSRLQRGEGSHDVGLGLATSGMDAASVREVMGEGTLGVDLALDEAGPAEGVSLYGSLDGPQSLRVDIIIMVAAGGVLITVVVVGGGRRAAVVHEGEEA